MALRPGDRRRPRVLAEPETVHAVDDLVAETGNGIADLPPEVGHAVAGLPARPGRRAVIVRPPDDPGGRWLAVCMTYVQGHGLTLVGIADGKGALAMVLAHETDVVVCALAHHVPRPAWVQVVGDEQGSGLPMQRRPRPRVLWGGPAEQPAHRA